MECHSIIIGEIPEGLLGFRAFAGSVENSNYVIVAAYPYGRVVTVSGQLGPIFDSVSHVRLRDNGNVIAYIGIKDNKYLVVKNGEILDGYDWVGKLDLSTNGQSVGYPIMNNIGGEQKYQMLIDGNAGPQLDCIGEQKWHPQEMKLAYVGSLNGFEYVFYGDERLSKFERIQGLQFSPQGQLYYWGLKDSNWWLCNYSEPISCSEGSKSPALGGLTFGRNGDLCYWSCKNQRWYVHYGNLTYGPHFEFQEMVGMPALSDDMQSIAYVAETNEEVTVFRNGVSGEGFGAVGKPIIRNCHLAYKARDGEGEFLVHNGERGRSYDVIWPEEQEFASYLEDEPIISITGKQISHLATNGTDQMMVLNGIEQKTYQNINGQPQFSTAHEKLVYGGQNGRKHFVVVDSQEIGPFDRIFSAREPSGLILWDWCPEFSRDGKKLYFYCAEDRKISKYTIDLLP